MTDLFLQTVNMSISATYLVLVVVLVRFLLKKSPKWVHAALWGLVAVRLLCPFTLESALSLMPETEGITPEILVSQETPAAHIPEPDYKPLIPVQVDTLDSIPAASKHSPLLVLSHIWLAGMAVMGLYTLVSYWRIRSRVRMAVRSGEDLYLSEHVDSPFVLGLWKPRIYMPYHMAEPERSLVIAHEKTHIQRKDHWWKPLGFALLAVHWFNPAMWIAYILLCRDIELACDEKVIANMPLQQRADYSQALLNCSTRHRSIAACPLAFGEVSVKHRVKNVLSYQKPGFWIVIIAIILCLVVAVCFLTDPEGSIPEAILQEDGYRIVWEKATDVEFMVPVRLLPDSVYTPEGADVDIPCSYSLSSGSIVLTHVSSDDGSVYLTFAMEYDKTAMGSAIVLPYTIADGIVQSTLLLTAAMAGGEHISEDDFALVSQTGERFVIRLDQEAWTSAPGSVAFQLAGLQTLYFHKDGAFQRRTPYPITQSLHDQIPSEAVLMLPEEGKNYIDRYGKNHISLDLPQVTELCDVLYDLSSRDFQKNIPFNQEAILLLSYGEREIRLCVDGEYVHFTFDDQTWEAMDNTFWSVKDTALNAFLANLLPRTDGTIWGVGLEVESADNTSATVLFRSDAGSSIYTGSNYALDVWQEGQWVALPTKTEAVWTTEAISIANTRRFKIDWEWLYGELPAGRYRISKDISRSAYNKAGLPSIVPGTEYGVVSAEFTLSDAVHTPYEVTSTFHTEDLSFAAQFLGNGGDYAGYRGEAADLVSLLHALEPEDFIPSPVTNPDTIVTIQNSDEEIQLLSDGNYVEIRTPEEEARWAVEDYGLKGFFRNLNRFSHRKTSYARFGMMPLESLTPYDSPEAARDDNVVVMINGDVVYNRNTWLSFVAQTGRKKEAMVRCMAVMTEKETEIYDIEYDREYYILRRWSNNSVDMPVMFPHLVNVSGTFPENYAADLYDYYILTEDTEGVWSHRYQAMVDKENGGYQAQWMVYQDITVLDQPHQADSSSVTPDRIWGVIRANLNWKNAKTSAIKELCEITDMESLTSLEQILRNSVPTQPSTSSSWNLLTLHTTNGDQFELQVTSDGSGIWSSGQDYYQLPGGEKDFYTLFAHPIIHSRMHESSIARKAQALLPYLNLGSYARAYGIQETLNRMDYLRDWALEQPDSERIHTVIYSAEGIEDMGASYTAYYGAILNQIFQEVPEVFAQVCLDSSPEVRSESLLKARETAMTLLASARGVTVEEVKELLLDYFPEEP